MGWVKLDDGFWLSEKVDVIADKAFRLYIRALSYAGQNKTDGAISKAALRRLDGNPKTAAQLVSAGLWESAGDGSWLIHDYLLYNPSRAEASQSAKKAADSRWAKEREAKGMRGGSDAHAEPDAARIDDAYAESMPTPKDPERPRETPKDPDHHPARELALENTDAPTWAIAEAWLGRKPSKTESVRLADGIADYGDDLVKFAIQTAKDGGKRDMTYMLRICQGHQQSGVPKESANANRTRNGGSRTGFRVSAEEAQRNAELFANAKAAGKVVE